MNSWLDSGRVTTALLHSRVNRAIALVLSLGVIRAISLNTDGLTNGPILCPIRLLTGYPCPACGTTRSIGAITEGRFSDALSLNPIGFLVIFALAVWSFRFERVRAFNSKLNQAFSKMAISSKLSLILGLYALTWIINIFRINSATF